MSDLNFFISQIELPVETVTASTPQSQESRRAHKNPVHTKLFVEPWNELPDITFASPGGRGQQGPGVTSMVGPQIPPDWLYEAESKQAPMSRPPPSLTDSSVPGKQEKQHLMNTTDGSRDTPMIHHTQQYIIILIASCSKAT